MVKYVGWRWSMYLTCAALGSEESESEQTSPSKQTQVVESQ